MAAESRRPRFGTIRVRVTALATVAVALVLVVASVLLVARQRTGLLDQLDETLSTEAENLADVLENGGVVPALDDDDRIVVVTGADGEVIATSGDVDEIDSPLPSTDDDGRDISFDDETYRLISASYHLPDGGEGVVHVAGARDDVDESVAELTASLVWIVPLAVLALLAVVWVVVGRTLRPVEQIRAQVAGIGVAELDRRVPEPAGDDEIARLAVTMNEMLARLERSVRRQQRFVADASHELRTPLTRMRTELEVDESDPAGADAAATRRSQLDEIGGLQRMIEDLLVLARSDAGTASRRSEIVDLDDIVLEEIRALGHSAITVDASRVSAAQIAGDRDELRRAVRNLIDNARRHANTHIDVELTETGTRATLVIADDGPGIPPERRTDVFERFARLDESRTGGAGRAGLGLAIVHDIVTRHKGTITIDDSPSGGARFVTTLPTR
jgi:signal transduction histidine kinase